ncbi:unnamed protein product, partial [Meganyctiphanes norvegica]
MSGFLSLSLIQYDRAAKCYDKFSATSAIRSSVYSNKKKLAVIKCHIDNWNRTRRVEQRVHAHSFIILRTRLASPILQSTTTAATLPESILSKSFVKISKSSHIDTYIINLLKTIHTTLGHEIDNQTLQTVRRAELNMVNSSDSENHLHTLLAVCKQGCQLSAFRRNSARWRGSGVDRYDFYDSLWRNAFYALDTKTSQIIHEHAECSVCMRHVQTRRQKTLKLLILEVLITNLWARGLAALDEEDEDEEDLGVAETYADYKPSKSKVGRKHPDMVVESSSLSSVEPPDVWYKLCMPQKVIKKGLLSALQLESIVYASQQHSNFLQDGSRAGFLIGDGAGVGKGRQIAGIVLENYEQNRKKTIWVSVSNDLKYDAERDINDIGAGHIKVYSLSKTKYGKINSDQNGNIEEGVIYSTYSAMIGESSKGPINYRSRLKQVIDWCGEDFDGCIIFDECHRAKNLCPGGAGKPTKTGLKVLELQNKLPKARVVYASATGATEPKNMAYMVRLGLWGQGAAFSESNDFLGAVEKRGVGAMEIVAMDMKLRGSYIARQLSFHGVTFRIEEVPLDEEIKHIYDEAVQFWVEARNIFQEASELINNTNNWSMWGQFWSSHQRFFKYLCIGSKVNHAVRLALEACKTNRCVVIGLQSTGEARTLEQVNRNNGELSEFVSTAKGILENLIEKHFPASNYERVDEVLGTFETSKEVMDILEVSGKEKPLRPSRLTKKNYQEICSDNENYFDYKVSGSEDEDEKFTSEKSLEASEESDDYDYGGEQKEEKLPPIPKIKFKCLIANEMKLKIVSAGPNIIAHSYANVTDPVGPEDRLDPDDPEAHEDPDDSSGEFDFEGGWKSRFGMTSINLKEKERFMNGDKNVSIISEAASSGISLQADRRVKNQRRRVHITLELPWSADRAIQQFGRTHRSNQVNAPEYVFLISELAGERRFASIVAKRLESLGALTHGDRRATDSRDLSSFNIDNKYGRKALECTMNTMMGYELPMVKPPNDYKGDFFLDCKEALVGVGLIYKEGSIYKLEKDHNNMSKFLNRILGLPVELQNRLFRYFTDTMAEIVTQAKRTSTFDLGILDLGLSTGDGCKKTRTQTWIITHPTGTAKTELHTVLVDRGVSWTDAHDKWKQLTGDLEGFYLSHKKICEKILVLPNRFGSGVDAKRDINGKIHFKILQYVREGTDLKKLPYSELKKKYKKVTPDQAKDPWEAQYKSSSHTCSHAYWQGNCRRVDNGIECNIGLRQRTYHVLCGLVLNVWARVEEVFESESHSNSNKMQVIRLKTTDGTKFVGTLIPENIVELLSAVLEENCENSYSKEFNDDNKENKMKTEEKCIRKSLRNRI